MLSILNQRLELRRAGGKIVVMKAAQPLQQFIRL